MGNRHTRIPYQAPHGQPARDTLRILEDSDGDGQFDRSTAFADNLNFPSVCSLMAMVQSALAFPTFGTSATLTAMANVTKRKNSSVPLIQTRDTQGMINALRRGDDGWIYACHGFNNQSTVAGSDGHQITLISGNTFRFRPDGSRVEIVSLGQVNPFGMDSDDGGNTTQLIATANQSHKLLPAHVIQVWSSA